MSDETPLRWGMGELPPIEGDPVALARLSCLHAVRIARDVLIDEAALQQVAAQLNVRAGRDIMRGHLGENCDTMPDEFRHVRDAINFAVIFSLLQEKDLYQFSNKNGALVFKVTSVNDPATFNAVAWPQRLWLRASDDVLQQLAAQDNWFKPIGLTGILGTARTLDVTEMAISR